jgi:ubiquinone biosynthesis protein
VGVPVIRHAKTFCTLAELTLRAAVLRPSGAELGMWLSRRLPHLGPTYVKLGQFISSRSDIFGDDFSACFASLRDNVPPIPPAEIEEVLRSSVDMERFASIERTPMASASIGQVHRATLLDGREVVVKIKRPGIEHLIREDVRFLNGLMVALSVVGGGGTQYDQAHSSVAEMETYLLQEVDFAKEAANIRRFAAMYRGSPDVRIPRVHSSLSGSSAVVMDYVQSTPLSEYIRRDQQRSKGKKSMAVLAANRLMDVFVSQLVYKGLVHGDPHPGNFGFDRHGRIVIYDFGNVIEVSDIERQRMKEMIYQLLLGNNNGVIDTLRKLGVQVMDEGALDGYIDMYREYMRTIDISGIRDSQSTSTEMPLRLTSKLMRLMRVYSMLEGTCKAINDDFNYFDMLDDYIDALFFDEEFVTYKISEDVRSLLSPKPASPKPASPSAVPAAWSSKASAAVGAAAVALLLLGRV